MTREVKVALPESAETEGDTEGSGTFDGASEGATASEARKKRSRSIKLFIRDIILIFVAALLISFMIKTFLIRSFYIPSSSMEQTLHIDDRIIVNQLVPELIPIDRGDVVVFRDPGGWLAPTIEPELNSVAAAVDAVLAFVGLSAPDSNDHLIKRVIGVPGDTVECCNDFGQLIVNGVPIEEPYATLPTGVTKATRDDFSVVVPEGYLWVMGDNRYNSADSVFHRNDPSGGFVPIENVVGRALLVSWPASNWTWLDDYSLTFQGIEDREAAPRPAPTTTPVP
jgi:signal peptidase I